MKPIILGASDPDYCLIQAVDDHDAGLLENEYAYITEHCSEKRILLAAFHVDDWNTDLSPWEAPAVFGNEGFGAGAKATLDYVLEELLPMIQEAYQVDPSKVKYIMGGYSLAGLFALWASYQTDRFDACVAASPSVWFPEWIEYAEANEIQTDTIYLSLGKKEEKTRNQTMARVGDCIRRQYELLENKTTTLEWNDGNHFREPDVRTAKGFVWCVVKCGH